MKVAVIGAGAAGLFCAGRLASEDIGVEIFERNEKPGKKIYITGKGRCNLTNNCSVNDYLSHVVTNPKFMYSAAYSFTPSDTVTYFSEELGLKLKTERGGRVFPVSDKASDVTKVLVCKAESEGASIRYGSRVTAVKTENGRVCGVFEGEKFFPADAVVVATGGFTYPSTGSTGDGYGFASAAGLKVIPPKAALVGLAAKNVAGLQGVSLKNVSLSLYVNGKARASAFGEMLFTHTGISGPVTLECSSRTAAYRDGSGAFPTGSYASVDLKPALNADELDARLRREFAQTPLAEIKTVMRRLAPAALAAPVLAEAGISPTVKACDIRKESRVALAAAIKDLRFPLVGAEGREQAIITSGGVDVGELDPKTMESRKVKGLYFVGEVIDVDALTGGFNLQTAFATADCAARAIKAESALIANFG